MTPDRSLPVVLPPLPELWRQLCGRLRSGAFVYSGPPHAFRDAANFHFGRGATGYGVYVIRSSSGEFVYIGKGGTVTTEGRFRGQDMIGRLKAGRGPKAAISADTWFADIAGRYGPISVEYVMSGQTPESPAFIEALLIQGHLNLFGVLPPLNKEF